MKYLLLFLYLLQVSYCNAQSPQVKYYNLVNYGEYLKYQGEYQKAYLMYQKAFKLDAQKHAKDYLAASAVGLIINDSINAMGYLKAASELPIGFNMYDIKSDSTYYSMLISNPGWNKILEEAIDANKVIVDKFNADPAIFEKVHYINELNDSDQYYNKLRQVSSALPEGDIRRRNYAISDSLFFERYYSYIVKNGYPGFWVTRTDILTFVNAHVYWPVLYYKFKKLWLEELDKGNMLPTELAQIVDRFEYATKHKCGIGVYPSDYCDAETDWKKIVTLRLQYGISPYFPEPRRQYNKNLVLNRTVQYIDFKQIEEWY